MEAAGLIMAAVSMVTLWNTCVQVFDTVAAGRNYGLDTEIVRVKLEVERARLLMWGEAVGLAKVQCGQPDPDLLIDPRLNRPEIRDTVMRLLGCVQRVFEDTGSLQKKYGLKPLSVTGGTGQDGAGPLPTTDQASALISTDSAQFLFGAVFKHAYSSLQKSAKDYKESTSFRKKTVWAISDKAKFIGLIAEIKGFNDSLVSLFPDVLSRTRDRIREDIVASDEIRSLQLLQEASAHDYDDISDSASVRLADLKSTAASSVSGDTEKPNEVPTLPQPPSIDITKGEQPAPDVDDNETSELEKALQEMELWAESKSSGALTCRVHQRDWSPYCSTSVHWEGKNRESDFWTERYKGFVKMPHDALEIYHRKRFIERRRERDGYTPRTDEDYAFFDIESDPTYENVNPGTVTVEGFGMECWDHQRIFGKRHDETILVSYAKIPDLPAKKLLRRLHELQRGPDKLGWNRQQDQEDLREFTGIKPLEHFPDASISGFTTDVLATLIVSDLWIRNVDLVLVDVEKDPDEKGEEKGKERANEGARKSEGEDGAKADGVGSSSWEEDKGKAKGEESDPRDDSFHMGGRNLEMHSRVHEMQVEGLLRFAEIMKWPFMNETRDYAEDVYSNLRGGSVVKLDIWDWLFGVVLPGKFAAFKIMAALVLCTPSLSNTLGVGYYFENGLSLPERSYWRTRTVLGRVLGCLPGVKSISGWVGPCPPIEGPQSKYTRLKARRVAPLKHDGDRTIYIGSRPDDGEETVRLKDGEDVHQWMAEIKDESRWTYPEPPVRQMTTCTVTSIRVKALALDVKFAAKRSKMSKEEIEQETEYRASITFKVDNEAAVTYTLYANPVFVAPPLCEGGAPGHPVHTRELRKFQRNVWNVEDLKDASTEEDDNCVLVINATGKGAEALARAWCSERGKNAVIRRAPGPCFVCAYDIASNKGLGINVLIWVS